MKNFEDYLNESNDTRDESFIIDCEEGLKLLFNEHFDSVIKPYVELFVDVFGVNYTYDYNKSKLSYGSKFIFRQITNIMSNITYKYNLKDVDGNDVFNVYDLIILGYSDDITFEQLEKILIKYPNIGKDLAEKFDMEDLIKDRYPHIFKNDLF